MPSMKLWHSMKARAKNRLRQGAWSMEHGGYPTLDIVFLRNTLARYGDFFSFDRKPQIGFIPREILRFTAAFVTETFSIVFCEFLREKKQRAGGMEGIQP